MALRREVKNIVKLFSDIEIKVREATSNDPWGAPTSLLSEIADATHDKKALSEIMQMIWKRLGENGKNWRHVHKSLIVLDYIVKTGDECVAVQCKENIFSIKTLEEFKYIDKDGKDQGINVREKSKQLIDLLKDEEILSGERERAIKAKKVIHTDSNINTSSNKVPKQKKFALSKRLKRKGAKDSTDDTDNPDNPSENSDQASDSGSDAQAESELEKSRPSTEVEEELQLQIALATSREDTESNKVPTAVIEQQWPGAAAVTITVPPVAEPPTLLNLLDLDVPTITTDTSFFTTTQQQQQQQQQQAGPTIDPWSTPSTTTVNQALDPFGPNLDFFDNSTTATPFFLNDNFGVTPTNHHQQFSTTPSSSYQHKKFIEIGAHLVDLNNIVTCTAEETVAKENNNPFKPAAAETSTTSKNPFSQEKPKPKSINELRLDGATYFDAPDFLNDVPNRMTTGDFSQNPFSPSSTSSSSWKKQVEVM